MAPLPASLPNLASLSLSTPLDKFFELWEANHGFTRRQGQTPIEEFERLAEHMKWVEGSKGYRKRYQEFVGVAPAIAPPTKDSDKNHPTALPHNETSRSVDYFATFISKGFIPDPTAPLASEFTRLAKSQRWKRGSEEYKEERALCFAVEFEAHYGNKSERLEGWQSLCREVDITPIPTSIKKCKAELRRIHINIVDLIDCRRTGRYPVQQHKSRNALRKYTKNTKKFFSLERAKENGFLTALLIQM